MKIEKKLRIGKQKKRITHNPQEKQFLKHLIVKLSLPSAIARAFDTNFQSFSIELISKSNNGWPIWQFYLHNLTFLGYKSYKIFV